MVTIEVSSYSVMKPDILWVSVKFVTTVTVIWN